MSAPEFMIAPELILAFAFMIAPGITHTPAERLAELEISAFGWIRLIRLKPAFWIFWLIFSRTVLEPIATNIS